ncbi:hypothetical protein [Xanthomonas arboricola]|uniref:hypothetical protein n=1 Tax=Xanthomonas arboricola TaxID=56448 RepID=UPI002012CCA4|nr:hypothetical protein [Xanthomonas arboricola]
MSRPASDEAIALLHIADQIVAGLRFGAQAGQHARSGRRVAGAALRGGQAVTDLGIGPAHCGAGTVIGLAADLGRLLAQPFEPSVAEVGLVQRVGETLPFLRRIQALVDGGKERGAVEGGKTRRGRQGAHQCGRIYATQTLMLQD